MITDIIGEDEYRRIFALWMLENDRGTVLPVGVSKDEFASSYTLPDLDFEHTQSSVNAGGDIITMLRSEIVLRDWETKNGHNAAKLTVYKVLKTFRDCPDGEPEPVGWIIAY